MLSGTFDKNNHPGLAGLKCFGVFWGAVGWFVVFQRIPFLSPIAPIADSHLTGSGSISLCSIVILLVKSKYVWEPVRIATGCWVYQATFGV